MVHGYKTWIDNAPKEWKVDSFLEGKSPIMVTSRFNQDAKIAVPGNEAKEATAWGLECDFSKLAFFTFALATTIK